MFGAGAQIGDRFSVAENDRIPFNAFASGDTDGFAAAADIHARKMAAVDVFFGASTIRTEYYGLLIGGKRPLLHFAISGSEGSEIFLFFSIPSQSIQMLP